jgi:hypothetical protein
MGILLLLYFPDHMTTVLPRTLYAESQYITDKELTIVLGFSHIRINFYPLMTEPLLFKHISLVLIIIKSKNVFCFCEQKIWPWILMSTLRLSFEIFENWVKQEREKKNTECNVFVIFLTYIVKQTKIILIENFGDEFRCNVSFWMGTFAILLMISIEQCNLRFFE